MKPRAVLVAFQIQTHSVVFTSASQPISRLMTVGPTVEGYEFRGIWCKQSGYAETFIATLTAHLSLNAKTVLSPFKLTLDMGL